MFSAATAVKLGTFASSSNLAAGASYTQTQSVALQADAAGDGYILVVADSGQTQAESSSSASVGASAAIVLGEPSLGIVASSLTAPASADLGQMIAAGWSVQNTGAVATVAGWSDSLYVSDNSTFDNTAQFLGTYAAPLAGSLAPGASYHQSVEVTLPYTAMGSRYLLLVADVDGGQPVSNSGPIVASRDHPGRPRPDDQGQQPAFRGRVGRAA